MRLNSGRAGFTDNCIEKWHGAIATHIGFAVAMTHIQAIVWRYIQGIDSKETSHPLIIQLQYSASDARSPLPHGLVVTTSAEPSFLVVTATSGHITYWESLSSAASIDTNRQRQQATQGTVIGMVSGEIITKVTEAEAHGFLLTFSTGRVAHLTVCDPQGKPSISVQYLRSGAAHLGGVFGSLRSVFSSAGWRRDVAAVKAGSSWQRGQRYAVIATTKGAFQVWDLHWNGTHSLVYEIDAKNDLLKALEGKEEGDRFQVLDFAFLLGGGTGKELMRSIERGDCKLLVLTLITGTDSSNYALVGLDLANGSLEIDVVHPIDCYKSAIPVESNFKPQVLVPEPSHTAFVVFEKSIVLVSLVEVEDSPSSQLQMEAHTLPDPFQDTLDFSKTKNYRVVGCAAEPLERAQTYSSCILMVFGFGIVRVIALPLKEGQSVEHRATVTAKTKIEQAVFYGSLEQNLLDFSGRPEITFDDENVEDAALQVSRSIMDSTSPYISAISPSMEQHLQRRSLALSDLMKHLKKYYKPVDRLTRWQLLWNAEKMAAAGAIWRCYNAASTTKREGDEKYLLVHIVEMLHQDHKKETRPERYETDEVRHWLIHDTWRLEMAIPWAHEAIRRLDVWHKEDNDGEGLDSHTRARLLSEANEIQLSILETAFDFRGANATLYGLEDENLVDGVLKTGYEDLPEIWTSTEIVVDHVKTVVDLSWEMAVEHEDEEEESMIKSIDSLIAFNPRLVDVCCKTFIERFRWLKSGSDKKSQDEGRELQQIYLVVRRRHFLHLSDIRSAQEGSQLADKYHDLDTLVDIIDRGIKEVILGQTSKEPGEHDSEKEEEHEIMQLLKEKIFHCFVKFGTEWATAYFTKHISRGETTEVFNDATGYQYYLTSFLRSPQYAKLGWINEVHSERNYKAAAECLKVAQEQESNVWNKKIELSMGKLAILAAQSKGQSMDYNVDNAIQQLDQSMNTLDVQEKLYNYIRPNFKGSLDATADGDLAMEKFGRHYVKGKPTLFAGLAENFTKCTTREPLDPEELIDTLTLLDDVDSDDDGFMESRFFTALKLLKSTSFENGELARKDLEQRIIWRRCMIQDDWEALNRTELKDDTQVEVETGATALFKTLREGYRNGERHGSRLIPLLRISDEAQGFRANTTPDFFTTSPPIPPSSALAAGTTVASLRTSSRYNDYPDHEIALLAKDLKSEDVLLETCIEKGRLEIWWQGLTEAARRSAREEMNQEGEEIKRKRSVEQGLWKDLSAKDQGNEDEAEQVEVEGNGDVVMKD